MLNLDETAIGKTVVVTQRMSAPNQPFTVEAGAKGVVKHVTTMMGRAMTPNAQDPTKTDVAYVPVPVGWVDFFGNGVCFAMVGDILEFEMGEEAKEPGNGIVFPGKP